MMMMMVMFTVATTPLTLNDNGDDEEDDRFASHSHVLLGVSILIVWLWRLTQHMAVIAI